MLRYNEYSLCAYDFDSIHLSIKHNMVFFNWEFLSGMAERFPFIFREEGCHGRRHQHFCYQHGQIAGMPLDRCEIGHLLFIRTLHQDCLIPKAALPNSSCTAVDGRQPSVQHCAHIVRTAIVCVIFTGSMGHGAN